MINYIIEFQRKGKASKNLANSFLSNLTGRYRATPKIGAESTLQSLPYLTV